MAEKIGVSENGGRPEKKKHRCCSCCLAVLVLILIIFAAAFGVGWYFGDKFTQENLDMSLADTLGVVNDLYWANDKKVVTNPYSKDDVNDFYKEIKRNVLLKDDAEVDFEKALESAIDNYANKPQAAVARNSDYGDENETGDNEDGEQESSSSSAIMRILTDMISGVLNRDNIDFERLNRYDENDPSTDEYLFKLKDKQLASFINAILEAILQNASGIDSLQSISNVIDLKSVLALKQITFAAQTDGDTTVSTTASVTVWIGVQSAAGQALTSVMNENGMGWLSWLARGMGNIFLPKNLYATVSIPLYGEADMSVNINAMNDAKHARAVKLVNGVMKMSGSENTLDDMLKEYGEKITPFLETASQNMPLDKVDDGTITIDFLDTLARLASKSTEGEPLTKADFIYVLKAVLSDADEQYRYVSPYRYKGVYLVDGEEKYVEDGVDGQTPIDYEDKFAKAISQAYSIDIKDDEKLADVLAMMGVSLDGGKTPVNSDELLNRMNGNRLNASINSDSAPQKLFVTDKMLAAAFEDDLKANLNGFDMELIALTFMSNPQKLNHTYAMIAVEVNLGSMLGEAGGMMTSLASGLMPDRILLTVVVDITQDGELNAGEKRDPVSYKLNSCKDTARAIAAVEKLAPSISLDCMSDQIETMMVDMVKQMFNKLEGMELKTTTYEYDEQSNPVSGDNGAIVMPDIFTIMANLAIKGEDGQPVVDGAQLKNVLKELNNVDGLPETTQIETKDGNPDYSGFVADVVDKYYLDDSQAKNGRLETFDDLTEFMSSTAKDDGSLGGFDTDKLRVNDGTVKCLAYDTRKVSQLKPTMTPAQLGAFLQTEMVGDDLKNYTIMEVETDTDELTLILAINVGSLLPAKVSKLLATENIFVTATIDMSEPETDETDGKLYYPVTTVVNNMSGADKKGVYDDTLKVVKCFAPDFDIQKQVLELGKTMYEEMTALQDSMTGSRTAATDPDEEPNDDNAEPFFRFEKAGLVMTDFYTFLAEKMELSLEGRTSETVKEAVQGMYVRSHDSSLRNTNNYVLDIFDGISDDDMKDLLLRNPAAGEKWDEDETEKFLLGKTESDIGFNGFMKQVEQIDKKEEVIAVQTIILTKGVDTEEAKAARVWLNERIGEDKDEITEDNDYLVVTFKLTMGNMVEHESKLNENLTPSEVYATIVYTKNSEGVFESVDTIFNGMTAAQYKVVTELMEANDTDGDTTSTEKVNIVSITKEGATVFNEMLENGTVTFGEQNGGKGIGSITYAPKIGSQA
ncbi:MAG: hypothetical protein HDT28_07945 [Clostridiales bacterium]|nr:hypothetical protein [Clostridiales bacterium]